MLRANLRIGILWSFFWQFCIQECLGKRLYLVQLTFCWRPEWWPSTPCNLQRILRPCLHYSKTLRLVSTESISKNRKNRAEAQSAVNLGVHSTDFHSQEKDCRDTSYLDLTPFDRAALRFFTRRVLIMLQKRSLQCAIPNAVQPLSGLYSDYELTTLGSDVRDVAYRCSKLGKVRWRVKRWRLTLSTKANMYECRGQVIC